ncbi:hypothetical protein [Alteromonas sp. RKMC-009]|uniref:hypothetical protein n=1 Tax=Alteromonas sp. RKMC-009 TaxID=2267264 RepID=UPI000E695B35|nr:hypothetical protein [Alteromonas sp. RKMC-009]AYA64333.1 hypothetical protein DS731_10165 [Alteromonas sp. RKMC-009]
MFSLNALPAAAVPAANVGINFNQNQWDPSFWDNMLGYTDKTTGIDHNGWGMPALQGLGSLAQTYLGFQQLGQAKDQFNFQKDFAIQNYNQQATTLNAQLEDRQRARLGDDAATGNQYYRSVGDYMNTWGAKEYGNNG